MAERLRYEALMTAVCDPGTVYHDAAHPTPLVIKRRNCARILLYILGRRVCDVYYISGQAIHKSVTDDVFFYTPYIATLPQLK